MFLQGSNQTIDIEVQAKKTLAFFSDYHEDNLQWERDLKTPSQKRKNLRILDPIKNIKLSRQGKEKHNNSQNSYKDRTTLIPYKISLENQQIKDKKNEKMSHSRNPYLTISKQNYKPHKTIRNSYSLTKQAGERQTQNGFDFMQYWIKHRFQQGAVNALVERLRQNKNTTIIRF